VPATGNKAQVLYARRTVISISAFFNETKEFFRQIEKPTAIKNARGHQNGHQKS
jgi:hypothetical protein